MVELEPIDELHAECIRARAEVRARFVVAQVDVAIWEPRPCPSRELWP